VIRGNMLAIPIEQSFLYVEPVYLQATQQPQISRMPEPGIVGMGRPEAPARQRYRSTAIPELKQVIVAFGSQVVMRGSFEEALAEIFGMVAGAADADAEAESSPEVGVSHTASLQTAAQMVSEAEAHFRGARTALQEWDWTQAGEELEALETKLNELRRELGHQP
jgi:uncharacterized membrane protein (UPF0182 family)